MSIPKQIPDTPSQEKLAVLPKKDAGEVLSKSGESLKNLDAKQSDTLLLEGKEMTPLDLSKLNVPSLIMLEDKYPGILLYVFTDIIGENDKIDFSKWEFYKKPIAGTELKVNFRGNEAANMEIGAADIFAPAVRCITVYAQGDKSLARTSKRRLGLKGRNRDTGDIGFFDESGYMPIFTGDVMVVGGAVPEASKNIDLNFEKPFLSKKKDANGNEEEVLDDESYARYEQSEEAKKDMEFLGKVLSEDADAPMKKVDYAGGEGSRGKKKRLTNEDIYTIEARNVATGLRGNIVKAILMVARHGGMGFAPRSCWENARRIYALAGVRGKKYPVRGVLPPYSKRYSGKDCKVPGGGPGITYATEADYDKVEPADWVYYNNKNNSDNKGNHSALFIEWIDRGRKLARVASGSPKNPWRVHTQPVDFNKMPMTYLGKPNGVPGPIPDLAAVEAKYLRDRTAPTLV
ncbi:MAG: hypothetical protein PHP74_03560 [Candidatus Gracilibacteria bacterium]|nr:hypothetical protein [Candidatus Gracilibacteria bacterium]